MYVVVFAVRLQQLGLPSGTHLVGSVDDRFSHSVGDHPFPVLGHEHDVRHQTIDNVPSCSISVAVNAHVGYCRQVSIKQRAYPAEGEQRQMLDVHFGQARFVFNLGLEQRRMLDRSVRSRGVRLSINGQMRQLTDARKEFDWLRDGSTVVQQGALRDLDRAFQNFFEGRAKFPRFRRRDAKQSFVVRDVVLKRLNRRWAAIQVPKAGWLRFRLSRSWTETLQATSARVSKHNNRWYVSLTTPPKEKRASGRGVVGLDRGVAVSVMSSDGQAFQVPSLSRAEQNRFLALERELATRARRSRNRERTKAKLAALRQRLNDRRADWIEKVTTELASRYEAAAVEKLNIKGMVKRPAPKPDETSPGEFLPNGAAAKAALARSIHASQWGKFAKRLADKTEVIEVPAANTSRRCFECDHIDKRNRKSQAVFVCTRCGHEANADVNAAKNIRRLAICGGARRERAESSSDDDANLQLVS